ncbi:MAG: YabP/YqfC family sporulation protein [Clostridiales bacterium]
MAENKQKLLIEDRNKLSVDGVENVVSFDNECIELNSNMGGIVIGGEDLSIAALNLDQGRVDIVGQIISIAYGKNQLEKTVRHKGKTMLARLIK